MVFLADIIKKFHFWKANHSFKEYKLPYTQMEKICDIALLNNLIGNKKYFNLCGLQHRQESFNL